MAACDEVHRQYDALAYGSVEVGELPDWMHVRGRVVFYVYRGPYEGLGKAWQEFARKKAALQVEYHGPPGDLFVCDPEDHKKDGGQLTILYAPIKG